MGRVTRLPEHSRYAALGPSTLLSQLAGAERDGELPVVTVYLTAGHCLTGGVVRVDTDRTGDVVVLAIERTSARAPAEEVAYFLVRDVVAVTVHAGSLPAPAGDPPTSRLALRREFPRSAEFPVDLDLATVPDTPDALGNLRRLLGSLRSVIADVRRDELGRQALDAVSSIAVHHTPGRPAAAEPAGDRLVISADFAAALPRPLDTWVENQLNAHL
jgi:hypothetical protein